jgi:transposase-like protein
LLTVNNIDEIKAYSTKELAGIYGVCDKTFKKWIKPFQQEIGQRQGRYYNVAQVTIIFSKLGVPSKIIQKTLFEQT